MYSSFAYYSQSFFPTSLALFARGQLEPHLFDRPHTLLLTFRIILFEILAGSNSACIV